MELSRLFFILGVIFLIVSIVKVTRKKAADVLPFYNKFLIFIYTFLAMYFLLGGLGIYLTNLQSGQTSILSSNTDNESSQNSQTEPIQKPRTDSHNSRRVTPPPSSSQTRTSYTGSGASIQSSDKFVTCKGVRSMNPVTRTNIFYTGERVYAWAQVYAPRAETVTMQWYSQSGRFIHSKSIDIRQNTGAGYRIYAWKIFHPGHEGNYYVRLKNQRGAEIGRREFTVVRR